MAIHLKDVASEQDSIQDPASPDGTGERLCAVAQADPAMPRVLEVQLSQEQQDLVVVGGKVDVRMAATHFRQSGPQRTGADHMVVEVVAQKLSPSRHCQECPPASDVERQLHGAEIDHRAGTRTGEIHFADRHYESLDDTGRVVLGGETTEFLPFGLQDCQITQDSLAQHHGEIGTGVAKLQVFPEVLATGVCIIIDEIGVPTGRGCMDLAPQPDQFTELLPQDLRGTRLREDTAGVLLQKLQTFLPQVMEGDPEG